MRQEKAHDYYNPQCKYYPETNSKQTWKQMGGGSSFIRTTAAGGTGNTPPGTGCKPGAVTQGEGGIRMEEFLDRAKINQK